MPRALVTGAAGTFGLYITAGLCAAGYETFAVVRSAARGAALRAALAPLLAPGAAPVVVVVADLASRASIAQAVGGALEGLPLDVLVNNAAVTSASRETTEEGTESQFAVNVLSYQRVLRAALPALLLAPAPRVVFVASNYAGGLRLDDVEFAHRPYDSHAAYKASKQANRALASVWAARQPRLAVYACHPGVADSGVARGLGMSFSDAAAAAREGAATPLLVATAPAAALAPSGSYYTGGAPAACRFAAVAAAAAALWERVERYDAP